MFGGRFQAYKQPFDFTLASDLGCSLLAWLFRWLLPLKHFNFTWLLFGVDAKLVSNIPRRGNGLSSPPQPVCPLFVFAQTPVNLQFMPQGCLFPNLAPT